MGIFSSKDKTENMEEEESVDRFFSADIGISELFTIDGSRPLGYRDSRANAYYAQRQYTALGTPAGVLALQLLSQTISNMPVCVVNSQGTRQKEPVWITRSGGSQFPELTFRIILEHIVSSLLLDGIAYVGLRRNMDGDVSGFYLIEPDSCVEGMEGKHRIFTISSTPRIQSFNRDGVTDLYLTEVNAVGKSFGVDDMLIWSGGVRVPGALNGISPLDLISDVLDIAKFAQRYGARYFESYVDRPDIIAVAEAQIGQGDKEIEKFKKSFKEEMQGEKRANPKAFIAKTGSAKDAMASLDFGDTPGAVNITDQQTHAMGQIAQTTKIPQGLLGGQAGGSSYNSLAIQSGHFVKNTIVPLAKVVSEGFGRILKEGHRLEFDTSDLLKGDLQTVAQVVGNLVRLGVLNLNEGREMLGKDKSKEEGMDDFYMDSQRVPMSFVLGAEERAEQANQPEAQPEEPEPEQAPNDKPESQPSQPNEVGRPEGS